MHGIPKTHLLLLLVKEICSAFSGEIIAHASEKTPLENTLPGMHVRDSE